MSLRRPKTWFSTDKDVHFLELKNANSWTSGEVLFESITATSNSRVIAGPIPTDPKLRGYISQVHMIGKSYSGLNIASAWMSFRNEDATSSDIDNDRFIDNLITPGLTDWIQIDGSAVRRCASTDVDSPYMDEAGAYKFNFGLKNTGPAAIRWVGGMVLRWCWTPDHGEPQ
jgi:hypothetical protein